MEDLVFASGNVILNTSVEADVYVEREDDTESEVDKRKWSRGREEGGGHERKREERESAFSVPMIRSFNFGFLIQIGFLGMDDIV